MRALAIPDHYLPLYSGIILAWCWQFWTLNSWWFRIPRLFPDIENIRLNLKWDSSQCFGDLHVATVGGGRDSRTNDNPLQISIWPTTPPSYIFQSCTHAKCPPQTKILPFQKNKHCPPNLSRWLRARLGGGHTLRVAETYRPTCWIWYMSHQQVSSIVGAKSDHRLLRRTG